MINLVVDFWSLAETAPGRLLDHAAAIGCSALALGVLVLVLVLRARRRRERRASETRFGRY